MSRKARNSRDHSEPYRLTVTIRHLPRRRSAARIGTVTRVFKRYCNGRGEALEAAPTFARECSKKVADMGCNVDSIAVALHVKAQVGHSYRKAMDLDANALA